MDWYYEYVGRKDECCTIYTCRDGSSWFRYARHVLHWSHAGMYICQVEVFVDLWFLKDFSLCRFMCVLTLIGPLRSIDLVLSSTMFSMYIAPKHYTNKDHSISSNTLQLPLQNGPHLLAPTGSDFRWVYLGYLYDICGILWYILHSITSTACTHHTNIH